MATSTVKFSVKLKPTNMEFVEPSRLKFTPDFQNTEEMVYKSSCSALINAVIEYITLFHNISVDLILNSPNLTAHVCKNGISLSSFNFTAPR